MTIGDFLQTAMELQALDHVRQAVARGDTPVMRFGNVDCEVAPAVALRLVNDEALAIATRQADSPAWISECTG